MKTLTPRVKLASSGVKSLTKATRITGSTLQAIRRNYFKVHPLCVECERRGITTLATELDHITPLCEGGAESDANRQGLCSDCHKAKSAAEARNRQRF